MRAAAVQTSDLLCLLPCDGEVRGERPNKVKRRGVPQQEEFFSIMLAFYRRLWTAKKCFEWMRSRQRGAQASR